jgi:O-antigen/teichoic acid export membrane protein
LSIATVAKNSAWIGVVQILNFAFPLLTLPVAARAFGPGVYGLIASLNASAAYAGLLITFGYNMTGPRLIARTQADPGELSRAFSTIYFGQLALAGIALLAGSALAVWTSDGSNLIIELVILVGVVAAAMTPTWMFAGLQTMRDMVLPQLLLRAVAAVLIVTLIRRQSDALLYVGINSGVMVLGCLVALLILRRKGIGPRRIPVAEIWRAARGTARLFVSSMAVNLYTGTNVIVVGMLLGPVAAGYFALADRVRGAVVGLFDPLSQSLYPYLCSTEPSASRDHHQRLFFRTLLASSVLATLALYWGSPLIALFLGGERFAHSVPLLRILSLTPVLICLSNLLGIQTMLPNNMERELSVITALAGVGGVLLLLASTTVFGLPGAAWSYVAVEAGVTLATAACVRRRQPLLSLFFKPAARPGGPAQAPSSGAATQ